MDFEAPTTHDADTVTDTEIWFALRAGQSEALGTLYDRHGGLVYGIALKVLGHPQEAEDLTQEIFIKLAQSSAYDPQRGSLRTFLGMLTRSRAIDKLRSRTTAQAAQARLQPPTPAPPATETLAQAEQRQQVKTALAQLSADQQQVLQLAYYEGLSQSAIAQQLNMPLGTVKAHARRGLLKLRQLLQDA
jgi:RNA polymerase sigma-70 factor (ECF subfamily)